METYDRPTSFNDLLDLDGETIASHHHHMFARLKIHELIAEDDDKILESLIDRYKKHPCGKELVNAGKALVASLDALTEQLGFQTRADLLAQSELQLTSTAQERLWKVIMRHGDDLEHVVKESVAPLLQIALDFIQYDFYRPSKPEAGAAANTLWLAIDLFQISLASWMWYVRGVDDPSDEAISDALQFPVWALVEQEPAPDDALPEGWADGVRTYADMVERVNDLFGRASLPPGQWRSEDGIEKTQMAARWWYLHKVKGWSIRRIARLARDEGVYVAEDPRPTVRAAILKAQEWLCDVPAWKFREVPLVESESHRFHHGGYLGDHIPPLMP